MARIEARDDISRDVVALTFDDGPSIWTDTILDRLARHDARATFFVLGCTVADRPDTVRRILESGSELGNHTFTHPRLTTLGDNEIHGEITRAAAAIEEVTGSTLTYWRAPFFDSDERVNAAVGQLGLQEVWYSSMPGDWELPAEETVTRVLDDLRPGAIVCLHDGRPPDEPAALSDPTREATAEAVGGILEAMDAGGLKAVTVSELLAAR
jgi:peptidoglycan/xylan/chitin deacetylase (PgdA/CDA1 family)